MRSFVRQRQQYGAWEYTVSGIHNVVPGHSDLIDFTASSGNCDGDRLLVRPVHAAVKSNESIVVYVRYCLARVEFKIYTFGGMVFDSGEIELIWMGGAKDGEIESYTFTFDDEDVNDTLTAPSGEVDRIISSLKSHSELRLRFRPRWPRDTAHLLSWRREVCYTEECRISLNGAARAIGSFLCGDPWSPAVARRRV